MQEKIKKIYHTFRSSEWWEYKISPILAIAYASCLNIGKPINENIAWITFLMFSIIIGAVFVSTINDITDISDDLIVGKKNRMANIAPQYQWLTPMACISIGVAVILIMMPDYLSVVIYILPWLAYSMYSFRPIRLKERGLSGVLADASGAHLFIGLLMISSISYINSQTVDWVWFGLIGFWSLVFGIRGILWHQFHDRENDILSNTHTYAMKIHPQKFKKTEIFLFSIEVILFFGILIKLGIPLLFFLLTAYVLITYLRYKILNYKPVIITNPTNAPNQILMLDFYLSLFPIGLLVHSAFMDPWAWVICGVHIVLFHEKLSYLFKDSVRINSLIIKALKPSRF